ncbi:hypothetical protein GT354_35325, partial [Streptomyces sp. SID3343]|nr:hypothetical protein [Streptomyces sp. SID3343]
MAGTRWIAEAEQIGRVTGGTMDGGPPRVVWHTVESPTGAPMWRSMADYLLREQVWPHLVYDPETDALGQYCALDQSARALRNDGSTRSNRVGEVCIQIEVLGRAAAPFTEQGSWHPGPNYRAMMRAIRSWGIPDRFPMGPPPAYPGGSRRDRAVWLGQAGHYCHANIPGNDHGDPGAIRPERLWAAATATTPPTQEDDMPSAREVAAEVWGFELPDPSRPGLTRTAGSVQQWRDDVEVRTRAVVTAAVEGAAATLGARIDAVAARVAAPVPVQVDAAGVAAALAAD